MQPPLQKDRKSCLTPSSETYFSLPPELFQLLLPSSVSVIGGRSRVIQGGGERRGRRVGGLIFKSGSAMANRETADCLTLCGL